MNKMFTYVFTYLLIYLLYILYAKDIAHVIERQVELSSLDCIWHNDITDKLIK